MPPPTGDGEAGIAFSLNQGRQAWKWSALLLLSRSIQPESPVQSSISKFRRGAGAQPHDGNLPQRAGQGSKMPLSGRLNAKMTIPARAARLASIKKKLALSMTPQKLPSQPARKLPAKLVASHRPIVIE